LGSCVKRRKPAAQVVEFPRSLGALRALFDYLEEAFEREAVDRDSAFWVTLAVEELFTNMIRHNRSNSDRITLGLDISDDRICARLTDYEVPPFDPSTVAPVDPTASAEDRVPGGLGVFFVRAKMDEVAYSYQNGNLSVEISKARKSSDG